MKRSEIDDARREATACFVRHHWALPPAPQWDITDFGLGDFSRHGLIAVTLANEPEYCEKLMYSRLRQVTPLHTHRKKKEDIICRHGRLAFELWLGKPEPAIRGCEFEVRRNNLPYAVRAGEVFTITAGERITLIPGVYHAFWADSADCIIGEVSTTNDDLHDNFFVDPDVGRFPVIEED
jgi:D-lyxose ketol-isomerase